MSAFSAAAQDEDGDIIKTLQARVADLEAQLYAFGAGGVGSTVARQDHPEQNLNMVPVGWKLVPVEPSPEMVTNGAVESYGPLLAGIVYQERVRRAWQAMLAAAPQPPVAEQPQSVTDCHQAQTQGEHEPVAWINPGALEWGKRQCEKVLKLTRKAQPEYDFTEPLYTRPPARQPLTNEQVKAGLIDSIDFADQRERCAFNLGVRFAERAHEIRGES